MQRITPELPYLDQAGHVYVPLAGPARSCLKLNRHASRVWREALRRPVDFAALSAPDRDFLLGLTRRGVLLTEPVPASRTGPEPVPARRTGPATATAQATASTPAPVPVAAPAPAPATPTGSVPEGG